MIEAVVLITFTFMLVLFYGFVWVTYKATVFTLKQKQLIDNAAIADDGTYVTMHNGDVRFENVSEEVYKKFKG